MFLSMVGLFGLMLALVGSCASVLCLGVGFALGNRARKAGEASELGDTLSWGGRVAGIISFVALTVCVGVLLMAFLTNDVTIQYVLDNRTHDTSSMALLYKVAGVWAGREGSLMFWAWLISLFSGLVAVRSMNALKRLDTVALLVLQLVLTAFVLVLMFSDANMPFEVTDPRYFNADGTLTAAANMLGMNTLLEHWAMSVHPPLLFVGYAGLTVPFAYAVAALVCNDASKEWVQRSTRFALGSWLFLGVGIELGAIWAYTVLGWGGYWGWDAVENASLLSWLMSVALIHSFTVYRQRGAFKGWAIMCACLTFCFVIVGTFISRSGIVQSVHAFEGDPVSLFLFGALIVLSVLVGAIGLGLRRETFRAKNGENDFDSMASKDALYYLTNVIITIMTLLFTYMTISSALPSFLPFGGQALATGSYDIIARPIGVIFLLGMAVCPLVGWGKTDPETFWRQARVPGVCAAMLFVVLMVFFAVRLNPAYDATIAAGGSTAEVLMEQGPALYYKGLTVVALATVSLLFFNSLLMLVRGLGLGIGGAKKHPAIMSTVGGALAHVGMAVILLGLVGSSMYVTERTGYLPFDPENNASVGETFVVRDYELEFVGSDIYQLGSGDAVYEIDLAVYKDGAYLGEVTPSVQVVATTQQQRLNAQVLRFPLEDLFVVYRGTSFDGQSLSLDVRVNPLVGVLWAGCFLLFAGMAVSTVGRRSGKRAARSVEPAPAASGQEGE